MDKTSSSFSLRKGKMKETLTQCGFELFATYGFHAVTLDQVVEQAGVTKGSFYYYYQSKHELILDTCLYYYGRWERFVQAVAQSGEDPRVRLRRVLLLSIEQALFDEKNRLFSTEITRLALQDPDVHKSWSAFCSQIHLFYTQLIQKIAQREKLPSVQAERNAHWIVAMLEGIKQGSPFYPAFYCQTHIGFIVETLMKMALASS